MYKVLLRFSFARNNKVIEVYFDERLSFKDNFKLLNNLIEIPNINNLKIYDKNKHMFLRTDISIKEFNINSFMNFVVY